MTTCPLVSICVPLFNKCATVEHALNTALQSAPDPVEIVVFDNGSTDGSTDIAARMAAKEPRIRLIRLEYTITIQESWRMALLHARGEFLKLQSADDVVHADFFTHMLPPLRESKELDFALCAEQAQLENVPHINQAELMDFYGRVNNNCRNIISMESLRDRDRQLVVSSTLHNCLGNIFKVLVRRTALPFERWRMVTSAYSMATAYPDWDFLIRLLLNHRGRYIDRVLYHYQITPQSVRAQIASNLAMQAADLQMHLLQFATVLGDPLLEELRSTLSPQEIQEYFRAAGQYMRDLINANLAAAARR